LALLVQDVHWADPLSLDVLAFVLRRMRGAAVFLMVTVADDDPDGVPAALLDLLRSPVVRGHEIRLGGPARPGGDRPDGLPPRIRPPAVPADPRPGPADLLRAAAVCGGLLPPHLVHALAGLDERAAATATGALRAAGLLAPDGPPRPADPAAAERVLSEMTDDERLRLSLRAAELGHRAALGDEPLARLLTHARPSGAPWATAALTRVAAACRARGDHEEAVRPLTRLLQEPLTPEERATALVELGAAHCRTDPEAGDRFLVQAVHLAADPAGLPQPALAADLLLARGDAGAARQALGAACRAAEAGGRPWRTLRALHRFAEQAQPYDGVLDGLLPDTAPDPDPADDDPSGLAAATWQAAVAGQDAARVRDLGRAVLALPAAGLPLYPRVFTCLALAAAGRAEEALTGLDAALAEARRRGMPPLIGLALLARCEVDLRLGHAARARRDLALAGRTMPPGSWYPAMDAHLRSLRGRILVTEGALDEAARVVAADCPPGHRQQVAWPQLLFTRGLVHLAADRPEEAVGELRECGRWLLARGWTNPSLVPWRCLRTVALVRAGRRDEAIRSAAEVHRHTTAWGTPAARGLDHLAAGVVARGVAATPRLRRAVALLREPSLRALAVRELGAAQDSVPP
jgi:tetratricopeptide (TPR) repeat protein